MGDGVKRSKTLHKTPSQTPLRHKISSPVELVHTTNMLSYNAPDLPRWPSRNDSVSTRPRTRTDSDASTTASGSSTPPTSPETEAYDTSVPSKNHLSSYFMVSSGAPETTTTNAMPTPSHNPQETVPAIPKRAASHTKKGSFDALIRKASMSRISKESDRSDASKHSLSFSRSSSTSTRASTTSASRSSAHHSAKLAPPVPPPAPPLELPIQYPSSNMELDLPMQQPPAPPKAVSHPFGQELAQVTEMAEEMSAKGRLDVIYEDEQYLKARGLAKMSADDYLNEIHSVMSQFFPETVSPRPVATVWI
jgi:hypothetical protein